MTTQSPHWDPPGATGKRQRSHHLRDPAHPAHRRHTNPLRRSQLPLDVDPVTVLVHTLTRRLQAALTAEFEGILGTQMFHALELQRCVDSVCTAAQDTIHDSLDSVRSRLEWFEGWEKKLQRQSEGCKKVSTVYAGQQQVTVWVNVWQFLGFETVLRTQQFLSRFHFHLSRSSDYLRRIQTLSFTDNSLWKQRSADPCVLTGQRLLTVGMKNLDNLRELYLSSLTSVDDGSMFVLSKYLGSNLATLSVNNCKLITDSGFQFLSQGLDNLHELSLGGVEITDIGIRSMMHAIRQLQRLRLRFCRMLTDSALECIALMSRLSLKKVKISNCPKFTVQGIMCFNQCFNLKELDLYESKVSDQFIKSLAINCGVSLEVLRIVDCDGLSGLVASLISENMKKLRVLDLSFSKNDLWPINDKSLESLKLKQLLELDLYFCTGVSDRGMKAITSNLMQLQSLNLGYSDVTDEGIANLTRLKALRKLRLDGCCHITSKSLEAISDDSDIEELYICGCSRITAECLFAALSKSSSLRLIDARDCPMSDTERKELLSIGKKGSTTLFI